MAAIRKRGAIYGVIALMLCIAVYLNWSYVRSPDDLAVAGETDEATNSTMTEDGIVDNSSISASDVLDADAQAINENDYFSESRLSRQKARDEAISILKQTTDNESASEKDKTEASKQITVLADNTVKEARIESLIKAKGYKDCVVFINENDVNVIVAGAGESEFSAGDASKIKDIVISETSLTANNIKIVEAD